MGEITTLIRAANEGDRQAIDRLYSHWDVMDRDSDLKPLRGSTEFQSLVARARKNAPHD